MLAADFGDGWMTKNASDLCKIMVAFGNADAQDLVKTISFLHKRNCLVNQRTVEKALVILREVR